MTKEEFKEQLAGVLGEVYETVVNKSAGYSGEEPLESVYETAQVSGTLPEQSLTTRINEKMIRFRNVLENPKAERVGETLYETITDVCGLAALTALVVKQRPQEEREEAPQDKTSKSFSDWFSGLFFNSQQ